MSSIYTSATKITLLMFAITVCAGFLLNKIGADIFIATATLVLGAYFGDKGRTDVTKDETTTLG